MKGDIFTMKVYIDASLKAFLNSSQLCAYKERDLMPKLLSYLAGENDRRVMVLSGLRRTGKTIMMQQAIVNHIGFDNTMYIQCDGRDTSYAISDAIWKFKKKYVFLDEVTKVPDFINMASVFSDESASMGHKVVMAGTDSLGFALVRDKELFDRMHEIRTTYISFSEYNRLTGKNLFEYMRYGGTLSDEKHFYNEDSLNEYTNSAIIDNIMHTYEHWDMGKHMINFYPAETEEDIRSLFNYYVREETKRFLAASIKSFVASEFHSSAQMFEKHAHEKEKNPGMHKDEHISNAKPLRDENLAKEWQSMLQIKDVYPFEITDALILKIRENLIRLDVLTYIKNDYGGYLYYFTQPGLQYCHIQAAINVLVQNKRIQEEYSRADICAVAKKITEDIEGRLLEDIILLDMKKRFNTCEDIYVRKFSQGEAEYDMVITNVISQKSIAFEIKRSYLRVVRQKRNLKNRELQNDFERMTGTSIVQKAILYSGETTNDEEGVQYINASDFLKNTVDILNSLYSGFI